MRAAGVRAGVGVVVGSARARHFSLQLAAGTHDCADVDRRKVGEATFHLHLYSCETYRQWVP